MWSHVTHSDSLMYWNTTATLLDTRGPVQGFLLLSLPWFVCMACWVSGVGPPHPLSSRLITRQGRKPLEFHESE